MTASSPTDLTNWERLAARVSSVGLSVRGGFHPGPGEFDDLVKPRRAGTFIMLGFTGGLQWPLFATSAEANDGVADPLDRWSVRVIGNLAREYGGVAVYPGDKPHLPFQRLAMRGESVHISPIGLLIHPRWGLWHAYRGALILSERIAMPAITTSAAPCATCASKPCLSACPVGAFTPLGFDVRACRAHVESPAGIDCLSLGCRARRACPIGTTSTYGADQARFHQRAFLEAARRRG